MLDTLPLSDEDPIQRMLASVVKGKKLAIEKLDRNELAALLVVRDWMDGILDELPDAAKIRRGLHARTSSRRSGISRRTSSGGRPNSISSGDMWATSRKGALAPGKEGHIRPCRQPCGGLHHR